MDHNEEYLLTQNKHIEGKLDHLFHLIEGRLDKIYGQHEVHAGASASQTQVAIIESGQLVPHTQAPANQYSGQSFATFKRPYIKDFRGFSAPMSEDVRQIQQLTGTENIDQLIQSKSWSRESEQQLRDAVLEHYASSHVIKLIKQKNRLLESPLKQNDEDVPQKLRLIDEQMDQVRARKDPKIFVPEDRFDKQIDWCAISAKLTGQQDARDCRLIWSNRLHWSVNDDPSWTKDEDICLINGVAKHGKNSWDRVARELNSGRLAWQCCARYNQEYAYVTPPSNKDDTDKLIEVINLCRIGNYVPWNQVMYFIQFHSLAQVKYQWLKYCSERRTLTNWTPEENLSLMRAVRRYGERDWGRIAACLPGRTNKSCRERYIMRLKYNTRAVGKWTRTEDARLMSLVESFGTNWPLISSHMSARNCHQLRNRYELLKKSSITVAPVKRRRLVLDLDGQFVRTGGYKRPRPQSERETDLRLREIFSTYLTVDRISAKSLTYRSVQDEVIYQSLVRTLRDRFMSRDPERSLLETIINRAIEPKPGLTMPCIATLRAYKAWSLQQEYLSQFQDNTTSEKEADTVALDDQLLQVAVSLFLWPALLSRLERPNIDRSHLEVGTIIEGRSKEFYKVRNLQLEITR